MMVRTLAVVVCLAMAGCGGPEFAIAPVDGVLMIKGKPADKVNIQFLPDIDKGTKGPPSFGQTDAEGRFTLHMQAAKAAEAEPGAVVGWHRVVLSDLRLAESPTGKGVPIRIPAALTLPGSTTLRQEVKPGQQTIELALP